MADQPRLRRKYILIWIKAGDYLLLSNDGTVLWRIHQYDEDGSASYADKRGKWRSVKGTRWALSKWKKDPRTTTVDPDEWDDFEWVDHLLRSRESAIQSALCEDEHRIGKEENRS